MRDPGRDRPLRPRCRSARRSTSPRRASAAARRERRGTRRSPRPAPPPSRARSREAWWSRVANDEGADEHAPLPLAHHRVPHGRSRRRVPWIRCQGAAAAPSASAMPGLDELALRGDLTRVGVDEERRPRRPRLAGRADGLAASALRALRRRPAPPRRGREHAPRLRRPTSAELARWASAHGPRARATSTTRSLRRYAAALSRARRRRRRTRRAQARRAARASSASLRRARRGARRTRRPAARAQARRSGCRASLQARRGRARCSTASRPTTPLELRDRALFELAYACGLRAEELVDLDVGVDRLRRRAGAGRGQGRQDALRARRASPRCARSRATSSAAGPRSRPADGEPALFLSKSGRRLSTSDVRRRLRVWARHAAPQGGVSPARPAPLVRDPPARGRRRPARDPGAARPRIASRTTQVYTRVESARLRAAYARSHPRA